MTKSSSVLLSLVAAIPGALLAFLLVMAFLNHADKMGGMLNAIVGIALLCGVAAALMPVGILVFGGPGGGAVRTKAPRKPKQKPAKGKAADDDNDDALVDEEASADDDFAVEDTDDEELAGSSDTLDEFEAEDSGDLLDEFDEDEDDSAKHEAADDEWEDSAEGSSDEFEFDDGLSDDELDFDFDDED